MKTNSNVRQFAHSYNFLCIVNVSNFLHHCFERQLMIFYNFLEVTS